MKRVISILLCVALVFTLVACGGSGEDYSDDTTLRTLYAGEVSSLNYLTTGNTVDQQVGANCIDTLVEFDSYGEELLPALATSWEHNDDYTVWTFTLREGVKWYDYQGNEIAELTAQDFVDAAKYCLTAEYDSGNNYPLMLAVKNAEAYYDYDYYMLISEGGTLTTDSDGEAIDPVDEVSFDDVGVKAVGDYTLEYTLENSAPYFLSMLTYVCFMPAYGPQLEELGADFGTANDKMYYCGSYILSEYEPQVKHVYVKNENNWDADNIFITRVEETYNAEAAILAPEMVLRGEVDYATLDNDIIDDWLANNSDYVSTSRPAVDYSYFYCLNFDPQFDAQYEPDNWRIAVNNSNFRHAIMSAFDRVYSASALVPNDTENYIQNTIVPATFCSADGVDYSDMDAFSNISACFYDEDAAVSYRDAAIEELTAAGCTFPIKVPVNYRIDMASWEQETILLEQQLEGLLGSDFIDIIPIGFEATGFLSNTRRNGNYAMQKCNYGADFIDPLTFTDPFGVDNNYNFMDTSDSAEVQAIVSAYLAKVEEAVGEASDMTLRYSLFAEAEANLIENAIVIPYTISVEDQYVATRLNPYEGQFASCGVSVLRWKGHHLCDNFLSQADYDSYRAEWEAAA